MVVVVAEFPIAAGDLLMDRAQGQSGIGDVGALKPIGAFLQWAAPDDLVVVGSGGGVQDA